MNSFFKRALMDWNSPPLSPWNSFFRGVQCVKCGTLHPPEIPFNISPCCGSILFASYDLHTLASSVTKEIFSTRLYGMWRFHELLPLTTPEHVVSLGEGNTPLIPLYRMARELGVRELHLKEEGGNPTGTFKARGASVGISMAKKLGICNLTLPTSGNAGTAWAAYSARAGMRLHLAVPRSTSEETLKEFELYGADIDLVDGTIFEAETLSARVSQERGAFDVTHFREPYRVEGKKTIAFEIAEQYGWELPDVVVYPTGGGIGPVGFWKGISELLELGWVKQKVRLIIVQASGCAPLVKAFQEGRSESEYWQEAHTIAKGLCTPKTSSDFLILRAVSNTNGSAISVNDEEIMQMMRQLGRLEGIFGCPEGVASLAAVPKLLRNGAIRPEERILLINTGTGLKYHKYI